MREERDRTRRQAAFDVADASILLLDAGGVVLSCSGNTGRLLGYPQGALLDRGVTSLLTDEDAARLPAITERCMQDGGWSGLLTARHRDGRPVKLMVRLIPVQETGGSARWVVLAGDLSEAPGWDMSRHLLERMASQSPIGIAVVDTDLRYVWSNAALERFGGGAPQQRLGRRLGDIQPDLDAQGIEAQMRRVLETGEPVIGYEHVGRLRSAPYREVAHSMSFIRLEDDHGHPVGVYYTVTDISDRYRARQRLALLDRAAEHIGRTLDVIQTGQELADSAVPELADFVAVDLLESVLEGAEPAHRTLDDPEVVPLRRAGHQSVRPGVPEAVVEIGGMARYHAGSPPIQCLTSGKSWREERLDPLAREWPADIPGGRAATFLDLGLHSVMIVPIRARGITLGITTFFRRESQEPFEADDLSLAEELVTRAAVCLDNARRYTRERDAALVLQQNLLPHGAPEQEAVDVATCYRPADELTGLAGDWFDLIPLSSARVALVVGEVVGHGIEGAAAMGRLRTAVQTLADLDLPPDEVLAHLDDLICRAAREAASGPGAPAGGAHTVGTSCLYAVYDPVGGDCVMASAGHLPPAILAPDGTVTFAELPLGPALGVGGLPFECAEFNLPEGSVLALHTDGLLATHAPDGTVPDAEAGRERLRRALEAHRLPLDNLCSTIVDDLVPTQQHDDAALLMARTRRLGADRVASWDLPAEPAVVAQARQAAALQLATWRLEELTFTTELVVSELVTNAIRHASGPLRLRLIMERSLICEVSDTGSSAPHLRHPRTTDEGGRGLFLVSQLTRRWGTRYTANGKIIWAEQPLAEPVA
ncbi:phosphoserine phosphatase RsbU [Streptomyces jeddahensis]|uniref:Phosphoserine phosphatase RsbU n=2 Tax=Streptomyces jeddahensis TaxID=1716141 RepID=A0A177HPN6_9ACTN|nr:SpoIIE family protein phosphatase [Streptomyces jeddahensis]OAH12875.1 phosphoserine phosphatase RsbU [Streptomyces jeddahensis]